MRSIDSKPSPQSASEYALIANDVFGLTYPLGFDRANKNPSRYSRLAGVLRLLPGQEPPPQQKLHYLNDSPRLTPLF